MEKEVEKYEEVKVQKKELRTDSYFDGKFMEYIGYSILAFLITIFSLTIAKPWADKLILDYKINHTLYNGRRLKFEGKGSALFVQRLKWIFFTIITLGIYSLWIPINMEKWVVSNIHFEDEELKDGESYFDGKLLGLIGVNLFTYLLTLISFGILFPFASCYKQKWIAKHTVINCKKIVFNGKAISIIGNYILWWLLSCVTLGIYGIWVPMKVYGWQVKNTHIKLENEEYEKSNAMPIIGGVILAILVIAILIEVIPKTSIPEVILGDKEISDIFKGNGIGNSSTEGAIKPNDIKVKVKWDSNGAGYSANEELKYGDTIKSLKTVHKEGYNFIRWEDQYGNEVKEGYIITGPIEIKAIWIKIEDVKEPDNSSSNNVSDTESKTKCPSGYTYSWEGCYNRNDYVEAITVDENGASGIKCPVEGYKISWDIENGFEGMCYKYTDPIN